MFDLNSMIIFSLTFIFKNIKITLVKLVCWIDIYILSCPEQSDESSFAKNLFLLSHSTLQLISTHFNAIQGVCY